MLTAPIPKDLIARYDTPGPRYTSYPTVPAWNRPFGPAEYREALVALAGAESDPVSIYVHIPFCGYRCHYCACNVTVAGRTDTADVYLDRLERELDLVTEILGRHRRPRQLHLGGGTPNFLTPAQCSRLSRMLENRFTFGPEIERSIECDPRTVTRDQLTLLHQLGFRRISFGVQDFDPTVQTAIGRNQPETVVRQAVEMARETGFAAINVDLVYGLPSQTATSFEQTLNATLTLRPERVACYNYAHVPRVRHNQRLIDAATLPSRDEKFHLFQMAVEAFTGNGYEWIGLDHFALQDDELARSARQGSLWRDFMGYTTRTAPHLLGFGMSAIGDVAGRFIQNVPRTGQYQRDLDRGEFPVERGHRLSEDDKARRQAILRLMCNLDLPYHMVPPPAEQSAARLQRLVDEGLLIQSSERYEVTWLGRWFLRNIAMALDAYLPQQVAGTQPVFSRTV
ncbi:MAG TPA: oxygen-independent coproporphyrinogen III oxidase [Gemmatimonadales bacterium]|nr:oxygen-independent coproporphyrinogen III oxidase [Gemmatimonadales bacterium]